ncbi:hypothetical protein GCM10010260_48300 [Streptomyces filipinensis]|uniref:Mce-associated membrane protein n=1 Tax=Streptomyces filipinensis TaxID=66887 RepID=A0A918IF78_9ACTN|nr:hypothetical protein [Streptomyces filipinensis]GGV05450.1 hypothetical protein GCM10010260_48300 [Streptomyces filipinensis]
MELPEENKRAGLLALAVLGVLLVAVLTVFTVFDGSDGEDKSGGSPAPSATTGQGGSGSGTDTGAGDAKGGAAEPIMTSAEATSAHEAMAQYMAGLNTYDHSSDTATWSAPLLRLTTDDIRMKQLTALPTGKAWAACLADRCSSKGTAVVVRDAVISDDLVRGSGRSISSLVKVTATRTAGGRTTTESNRWLVSVKEVSGRWLVSGFDVFGLGDVGASDDSGA